MNEIMLWTIDPNEVNNIKVEEIQSVQKTESEYQLEEIITNHPEILMKDMTLIGRQTRTPGGPLDLLGVDGDGRLVVFELKRGTLTRDAIAQIIDYASSIAMLDVEVLSKHISSRSGNLGIEKIENFQTWYVENHQKPFEENQKPRMILVGLGADENTKRMVSFLSEGSLDISLITFHGFKRGEEFFLARQIDIQSKSPTATTAGTKMTNSEELKRRVNELRLDNLYYEMAAFFNEQLPASYEWPNQGGYSYSLLELTETGRPTNRVYVSLYIHEAKVGMVQIYFHPRAVDRAVEEFLKSEKNLADRISSKNDGSCDLWVNSLDDWNNIKSYFTQLCPLIILSWNRRREQQSKQEIEVTGASTISKEQI